MIDRIDVYRDELAIRLRSRESPGKLPDDSEPTDDRLPSFPWQKPSVEEMPTILYVILIVANRNRFFFRRKSPEIREQGVRDVLVYCAPLPLLSATGCSKNVAVIANQAEKRHFVDHCGRPSFKRIAVSRRLSQGGHDEIHQLHSDQQPDTGIESAPGKGNDLASVDGLYTETHDHRQACARTGLAASQRSALVV